MLKMTRNEAELKGLMRKAVKVKQDHRTLNIPAAMRVEKFTNKEAYDRTLQQQVCRIVSPPTMQINNYLQWWDLSIDEYRGQRG